MEEDETLVVVKAKPDPPLWAVPPVADRRRAEEGAHGKRLREEGLVGKNRLASIRLLVGGPRRRAAGGHRGPTPLELALVQQEDAESHGQ